jgi:hypothetical protein
MLENVVYYDCVIVAKACFIDRSIQIKVHNIVLQGENCSVEAELILIY